MAAPKVITWGDIREGDDVSLNLLGQPVRVEELRRNRFGVIYLNRGYAFHNQHAQALLLHRPWPEGKTKADMLADIMEVVDRLGSQRGHPLTDAWLAELREATNAYELGKPKKPMQRLR